MPYFCVVHIYFFSLNISLDSIWFNHTVVLTSLEKFLCYFIRSNFQLIDNLPRAIHAFFMHVYIFLVDEVLLLRYVNWSTNFIGLMASSCLKHMNSVISEFMQKPMPLADCSRHLACAGVFARNARSSA